MILKLYFCLHQSSKTSSHKNYCLQFENFFKNMESYFTLIWAAEKIQSKNSKLKITNTEGLLQRE